MDESMIKIIPVKEYNRSVKPDKNFFRSTFKTNMGYDREFGYVAFYNDSHFWARTKKEALKNIILCWNN